MGKINLTLEEVSKAKSSKKEFKVKSDIYTKMVVQLYIEAINPVFISKNNIKWDLEKDILHEAIFTTISNERAKEKYTQDMQELSAKLQFLVDKAEADLEEDESISISILENLFRDLIEEYTTALTSSNKDINTDIDFESILANIKLGIKSNKINIIDTMGFVSDLNDMLTEIIAGKLDE